MRRLTLLLFLLGFGSLTACSVALGPIEACGNGVVEAGEDCDGQNLAGKTCESLGQPSGTLVCTSNCGFDITGCDGTAPVCGDGSITGSEQCDGTNLNGQTCISRGYDGGTLACTSGCVFDTSGCTGSGPVCGDGEIQSPEVCDGTNLGGENCTSRGFSGGTLTCSNCMFNTIGCTMNTCDSMTNPSYRGCEFWAVSMANSELDSAFHGNFGLVIDNANDAQVRVQITGGSANVDEQIPANTGQVILLDFNEDSRMAGSTVGGSSDHSGIYRAADSKGAYHIETSLPVALYQFSPFDFQLGGNFSYSNDASLLIPVSVLSGNYRVMGRPTLVVNNGNQDLNIPGVLTVVATADNTQVTIDSKAYFAAGVGVGSLAPGGTVQHALNKGDVLQLVTVNDLSYNSCPTGLGSDRSGPDTNAYLYCNPGNAYDLTGSKITSNNPLAVWAGHNCVFIPYNYWACDHLEDMMFPIETWGKHFMVGLTHPVEAHTGETNVIRVLAAENGVQVAFNPAIENPATLNAGEYIEFMPEPGIHFEINATGPIMVGKFTVGQNYWTTSFDKSGDPAFSQVVPVEQYRSEYTFATPSSFTVNYVNVIAEIPVNSSEYISCDGVVIGTQQYIPIGSTGWGVAQIDITSTGNNGGHIIIAPNAAIKFGIEVYGFAQYTSYLYPGGLNLEYINPSN